MKRTLTVRAPRLALDSVGPDWFGGHHCATQLSNALHLLFPAGERFFVRSVLRYRADLPAELSEQVRAFCKQEGRHAQAHERFFENLRARGYPVDAILDRYERAAFGSLEKRLPPWLCLSMTVALEHFTAMFAADALSRKALASAEPEMRALLTWHALEELEHKAVAFDVMRVVSPGYFTRIAGLVLASAGLAYFWFVMAKALLAADGVGLGAALRALRTDAAPPVLDGRAVIAGVWAYLRPGFHPDDVDHGPLVAETAAELSASGVV